MESLVKANLVTVRSAAEAISHIRDDRFESVLSRWDLEDMPAGLFLKKLRLVRPDMTTVVLICGKDVSEEISARSIGVSAVLTEDCSDELLLATVASVLGIAVPAQVGAILEGASKPKSRSGAGVIR